MPAASAAVRARDATYGPRNTVPTVVLNAEFAQSYMAQPKISFLSFTIAASFAIHPPKPSLVVTETTRASISSFGLNVKKVGWKNIASYLTLNLLRAKMLVLHWKRIRVILSEAKNLYDYLRDPLLALMVTQ